MTVVTNITVNRIVVEKAFTSDTLSVVVITAGIANQYVIAVFVKSKGNVIGREVFVALRAKQVFVGKAT